MSHCCGIRTMCQENALLFTKAFHEQGSMRGISNVGILLFAAARKTYGPGSRI